MVYVPSRILGLWLRGLVALAIPIVAIWCLKGWYDESHVVARSEVVRVESVAPGMVQTTVREERVRSTPDHEPGRSSFRFEPGWNRATAWLVAAVALIAWAIGGAGFDRGVDPIRRGFGGTSRHGESDSRQSPEHARVIGPDWLSGRGPIEAEEPRPEPPRVLRTGRVHRIPRPDGSELHVETYGPDDAPTLVFTHGWGATSDEWYYQKVHLAGRFRLIVWDLPGLGFSRQPDNRDFSMEKMAADLEAVLALAGGRPVVLVGHSIGVMILLTFCRVFREDLGRRVAGIVLAHGSHKDPIQTVKNAAVLEWLRYPLIIPLLRLTIWLWPLVQMMKWMCYANGMLHRQTRSEALGGSGTPAQVAFLARFLATARPDVLARGMFGMMAFDESDTLPTINVPTLVLIGDRDTTTLPEAGEYIARHIPGALAVTLAPARHLGLFEYHGQFDQILADFAVSCLASSVVTT